LETFEWIIGLMLGALVLSALARRLKVPYPTFLALGGAALAFLPSGPEWTLEPELALALFVAPVLLDAAYDTSLRDLRDNWVTVTTLVIIAVGLTTAAVAVVAHWLVPGMPWAAAIALGAIVAPPDAAAATAILRQVRLPHRLMKILEGESLLNDASALLIYRVAVAAVALQSLSFSKAAPSVLFALFGSLIAGYGFAKLLPLVTRRVQDPPSAIIIQFATTFLVWIVAEKLGLSGILTIVVYAVTIARTAPAETPARIRVPSYAVWDTVVFMLNVLAFVLIGMQLRPILANLGEGRLMQYLAVSGAVLLTVIVVRLVWVMGYNTALRLYISRYGFHPRQPTLRPTPQSGLVVAWCGMRGIVTLAAAFALPDGSGGGAVFPYRDLILLSAFVVVLGSLLIQGLTLGPLVKWLKLDSADVVGHEVNLARAAAWRAALNTLDGDGSDAAKLLRKEYEAVLAGDVAEGESPSDPLRLRALAAARQAILAMRESDEIGDDAFHRLEEELDFAELTAGGRAG
jgi:CPA1 family monovalent cation:H+ antiporter